jgi:O-antigen/teichoic acid export membrane protein
VTTIVFATSVLIAIAIILFAKDILGWFGQGYLAGYGTLLVLASANVWIATFSMAWPLLSLGGYERVPLRGLVVALVSLVLMAEILIPRFGIWGAALCRTTIQCALFAWLAQQAKQKMNVSLWQRRPPHTAS